MQIDKIYNNNVVQVLDDKGREIVVMGKGLGFQKKPGDELDSSRIEKTFVLQDMESAQALHQLYSELDDHEVSLVLDIIHEAETKLNQTFDNAFYVAFADHVHYTLERVREGLLIKNPLSWEVRKFYPTEFSLGKAAVAKLEAAYNLFLGDDEAASLALHFVNAQKEGGLVTKNRQISQLVVAILDLVRLHFGVTPDENDISYNRFVTHVRYFAQRVVSRLVQGQNDAFLYEQVRSNYPQAFACTEKIKAFIEANYDFPMSRDEQVYLTIHIQRLNLSKTS